MLVIKRLSASISLLFQTLECLTLRAMNSDPNIIYTSNRSRADRTVSVNVRLRPGSKTLAKTVATALLSLACTAAIAAPFGYSVNSDEDSGDRLYRIDLATGISESRGLVQSASTTFTDVEGLAFDQNNQLWGIDDQTRSLFPLSTGNGTVDLNDVEPVTGFNALAGNDFGMTFNCSGELYISSVAEGALFLLSTDGTATRLGSLGANISALASYGSPARLFGLGNGLLDDVGTQDNRSLYEINTATGAATLVGSLGNAVADYYEAGLAFDEDGQLWAITDRNGGGQARPSEILRLDMNTGTAALVATTTVTGFESLAIAPPSGCALAPAPPNAGPLIPTVPTLGMDGKLASIIVMLLAGLMVLRARP